MLNLKQKFNVGQIYDTCIHFTFTSKTLHSKKTALFESTFQELF